MQTQETDKRPFLHVLIIMLTAWSALLAGILFWNIQNQKQSMVQLAEQTARMSWEKDILYRLWGARHGVVYVPVSSYAKPNPYLKVKNRDVLIGGREYTLVNPAYMTRQVYDLAKDLLAIQGHITSLNPIRPENSADIWEQKALRSFEEGGKEYKEVVQVDGESYLRLMRPFITKKPCLRCHAVQGYKVGDVRGGISIRVPMANYHLQYEKAVKQLWGIYLFIWFLGVGFVFWSGSIVNRTVNKLSKSQKNTLSILENIDSAGLGVYIVDDTFRIRHMNKTMQKWVNGKAGQVCHETLQDKQKPCDYCFLDQIIRQEKNVHYELKQKGYIFDIVASPITLEDGTVAKMGIRTDITSRRQSEKDLIVAKEEAEAATVAQSAFLANMSHDIRTPLNGIIGMLRLTLDTSLTDAQRKNLASAQVSADFLFALLNDILDLSKIDADQLVLEEHTFRLTTFLDEIQTMFSHAVHEKSLEFTIVADDNFPDVVKGDSLRLRQVIMNFLSNSIKFTDRGTISLSIETVSLSRKDVCFKFLVKDTGIGIAEDMLEKIFDSFSQADASTTRKYGGTGLGLAICHRLIELMGGTVKVSSIKDEGSTFSFTTRLKLGDKKDLIKFNDSNEETLETNSCLTILLVEDNTINRDLARLTLEQMGHTVHEAANGLEALKVMENQFFDVILMDVQMPVMDGLTATQTIRLCEQGKISDSEANDGRFDALQKTIIGRKVPIIALTANAMAEDRVRCLKAGMDEYLSKPFLPDQVAAALARVTFLTRSKQDEAIVSDRGKKPHSQSQVDVVRRHFQATYSLQDHQIDNLLLTSIAGLNENIEKAQQAVEESDNQTLSALGHAMKGILLSLGLEESAEMARLIEYHAGNNDELDYGHYISDLCSSISELLEYTA